MRILRLLIVLLSAFSIPTKAQIGHQNITYYPPSAYQSENYSASPQNWAIIQDSAGIMYFGNSMGILTFDGHIWQLVKGTDNIRFHCFEKDQNGTIFAAGESEIGYLSKDKAGYVVYHSLRSSFPKGFLPTTVKQAIAVGDSIFFKSYRVILCWAHGKFKYWRFDSDVLTSFYFKSRFYIQVKDEGIYYLKNGAYKIVESSSRFISDTINHFLSVNSKSQYSGIVFNAAAETYKFDGNSFKKFPTEFEKKYGKRFIWSAIQLSNDEIALGTADQGIIIIDTAGKIIHEFDSKRGLSNEATAWLFADKAGSLWSTFKGIYHINYPSSTSFLDQSTKLDGIINSTYRYRNQLWIGSTQGLYKLGYQGDVEKERIISNEVWCLAKWKNSLIICSAPQGLFEMNNGKLTKISDKLFYTISVSKTNPNLIYAGCGPGIWCFLKKGNDWINLGTFKNLSHEVKTLAESPDGKLWCGYEQLSYIEVGKDFDPNAKVFTLGKQNGLDDKSAFYEVSLVKNKVRIGKVNGIFVWDEKAQKLVPDPEFSKYMQGRDAYTITEDKKGNIWYTSQNRGFILWKKNGDYVLDSTSLIRLPKTDIWHFYPEDDGVTWISTTDGLFRYDSKVVLPQKVNFPVSIRDITLNSDSTIFYGAGAAPSELVMPYGDNTISFSYSPGVFSGSDKVMFSYRLSGDPWSAWSREYKKEYTHLREGKYAFEVKARDMYGNVTGVTSFSFQVLPPWYRTWWAWLIYAALMAAAVRIGLAIYIRRHETARKRLEGIIEERTHEITAQKEIIEQEKSESDRLLRNILPDDIAAELKHSGKAKARRYERVSVMFADVSGFTKIAEQLSPEALVGYIDEYIQAVDSIIEWYNLEKIKTIGDAYMCAGGLPDETRGRPEDMVAAALEIQRYMDGLKLQKHVKGEPFFNIRIGIHTGPVVAGVVGSKKFAYDIWGDTVNTAARIEQAGEAGKVNISETTYELIKDKFTCTPRGKVKVKYKGEIDMYFVNAAFTKNWIPNADPIREGKA